MEAGQRILDVVICTYNRATLLHETLASLAAQDASDDERWAVLVVDNNCTDNTQSIIDSFRDHLPGLRTVPEPRQGLTEARQRGLRSTQAPWVAFVDDDCRPEPDWIDEALRFIERRPEAAAFNGHNTLVFTDGRARPWVDSEMFAAMNPDRNEDDLFGDRQRPEGLHGAGLILRRQAVLTSGWLDQPWVDDRRGTSLVSGGDNELALRTGATGGGLWFVPLCRLRHVIEPDRLRFSYLARLTFRLAQSRPLIQALTWPDSKRSWRRRSALSMLVGLARAALARSAWSDRVDPSGHTLSSRGRAFVLGWCKSVGYAVGYLPAALNLGGRLDRFLGLAVPRSSATRAPSAIAEMPVP